ncbi:Sialoadhesin, partial [Nibea albiflora]
MTVLLLVAEVDFSYSQEAGFPQVVPSSQQHFQYEHVVVSCEGLEGLTGWRVMKKVKGGVQTCAPIWSESTGPCIIQNAYLSDTGEYWCEMGGGRKSETVNITVTAGPVILESPVHPVMEGDAVTLRCRMKPASSNLTADFFKDGHLMESSSAGNLTFTNVSKCNEGLYKCRLSGAGESPESWLHVRGFPQVVPSSQQHFQYEHVVVSCEGLERLTGWRVMKRVKGGVQTCAPNWSASTGPCTLSNAFLHDTGEYWCEMGGGRKSETVNITVTAGPVILESPVHPVMEGDAVTLRCRMKSASSNLTADFFKDGHLMESSSAGNLTFTSVSRSNEGLYKCGLSGAGESPESWLHVRDQADAQFLQLPLPLWVGLGVCLFLVALLLLIALLRWRKQQTSRNVRVSRQASVAVPIDATYAVVTKAMMEQGN